MANHLPPGLSPDTVDALTELTSIITRLRSATATTPAAGTTSTAPAAASGTQPSGTTPAGVTGTTPLPTTSHPNNNSAAGTTTGAGTGTGAGPEGVTLSAKDLPAATDNLKHKLQRARAAIRALDDVRRSIAAQEAEMAALEERRRAQARRLAKTQEDGLVFVRRCGEEERGLREGEGEGDRMVE